MASALTAQVLRSIASYDPGTGIFTAKTEREGSYRKIGDELGTVNVLGYVVIRIEKKLYLGHRLAWLYMTGEWPTGGLDHANGTRSDNRWANLRCATQRQNLQNSRKRSDNISGFKGVRFRANRGHWYASLKVDGRNHYLGAFRDPVDAHLAYKAAAERHFGQFARAE
jgi:hypothetical protein